MSYPPQGLKPPPLRQNNSSSSSNAPSPQPSSSSTAATAITGGGGGLRYPSNRKTIYDRNLNRSKTSELSRASFAYLFGEMITYAQRRVTGIQDLEKRLNAQGYPLGLRLLDLLMYRDPSSSSRSAPQRPTRILALLQFITTTLWRHLFGRQADALERSKEHEDEYMISDNEPLVNAYISVPREMSQLNCAAFVAGVVEGVCDGTAFNARVTAHTMGTEMWPAKTVFLIKFVPEVLEREAFLVKV
ncbi:MAG: TRAPP subunit trs31 [Peltula sp. TS41687]|nr:MAG: TRAPP subunit trs31 [Peltula sp. TS41687]